MRKVKQELEALGLEFRFSVITDNNEITDILLLINGCRHACTEVEYSTIGQNERIISVKGDMVDDSYLGERDIPGHLVDKISVMIWI